MGRPRADSIDIATPERLLAAAEAVFAGRGVEGAALADIAQRAGISRPALLYHFATKETLYEAVVGRAFSSLAEILTSAMSASGTFRERVRAVVEGFLTYVSVHPALARIIVRELTNDAGPGRALLVSQGAPLVDAVVEFMEREGRGELRKGVDVRAALMLTVSDVFMRTAAGDIKRAFWGDDDHEHTWRLAESLMLNPKLEPST
jgi:TetR/AcrR family transcriptional regulator